MNGIGRRLEKLEAERAKAGTFEAGLQSLTDDDLDLCVTFLRHVVAELADTEPVQPSEDFSATAATVQEILQHARQWAASQEVAA